MSIRETTIQNATMRKADKLRKKMDFFEAGLASEGLRLADFDRADRVRKPTFRRVVPQSISKPQVVS
jgi:hypothetical protein